MAFDLCTTLLAMGVRFTLVLGVMLFILTLDRDTWSTFSSHE